MDKINFGDTFIWKYTFGYLYIDITAFGYIFGCIIIGAISFIDITISANNIQNRLELTSYDGYIIQQLIQKSNLPIISFTVEYILPANICVWTIQNVTIMYHYPRKMTSLIHVWDSKQLLKKMLLLCAHPWA